MEDVHGRRSFYPPAVAEGRALVGSGDGYAYAFEAATGRLLWRFRAGPADRTIRVYDRLLSTWPVATGVLVDGQTAYCAAGINNYDGTHVYALDAASGAIKWQNSSAEGIGAVMGAGVAVQGDLLLDGGKLYLAGGSVLSPAAFDLATGEFSAVGQKRLTVAESCSSFLSRTSGERLSGVWWLSASPCIPRPRVPSSIGIPA